jgi:hypothetical protein
MQHMATAIVSVDRDHVAGELRTRADDMRGVLRRQGAQAREALRTLLVDRFDCTPVLVAGTRGYAFTGDGTFGGLLAASTCRRPLPPDFCRLFLQFLSPTGRALGEDASIFSFSKMAFHLRHAKFRRLHSTQL